MREAEGCEPWRKAVGEWVLTGDVGWLTISDSSDPCFPSLARRHLTTATMAAASRTAPPTAGQEKEAGEEWACASSRCTPWRVAAPLTPLTCADQRADEHAVPAGGLVHGGGEQGGRHGDGFGGAGQGVCR